ncbi:DnaB-like helicase C-terminal domain-containing protein [Mycoplasmopsis cynos]|uniref:DnaB-like helicase C-terminal domain-containing protein n=1 Tax=Mycoplasmopsis cynos TaxID=171284 RepID=UPI0024CA2D26|nr:DnaB-like helicase C-terminal domain-containing protein [Mycoplasmopsis cynos]WAM11314.1 DnaB-like helicase C-terminal domain-containing protein [Mycoplasmopsis cynos]
MSNIPLAKLQKPSLLDSTEMTSLRSTIITNKDLTNLYLDDNTSSKISDIIWKIRQLNKEIPGGLQLIVIDYLQLISGSEFSGNRQNEIAQISRSLKLLALDLKIPIIALSQLSRTVETRENKRPQLSDLRESGVLNKMLI